MANLNMAMLMGRCGQDPEMRFTPNGTPVTTFSIAVNSYFGSGDERKERTDWFNIVAWNKLAELTNQYLNKGSAVYVQGRIQNRSWEDPEGQRKHRTEVVAEKVQFLSSRKESESMGAEEDDLPF
jgi:single-strand DNA-binding protein